MTKILLIDLKMNYFLTGKYLLVTMPNRITISNTQDISKTGKLVSFRSLAMHSIYFQRNYISGMKHNDTVLAMKNYVTLTHYLVLICAHIRCLVSITIWKFSDTLSCQVSHWHQVDKKNLSSRINHLFYHNKMNRSR